MFNISVYKTRCCLRLFLLSVAFFFLVNHICPQEPAKSPENQFLLANGIYLVLQESENPKEIPNANTEQVVLAHKHEFSEAPDNEPTSYLLVARQPSVPLILENTPAKEKDQKGKTVLRLRLAEKHILLLKEFTGKHIGSKAAVIIGGKVVTAHKIRAEISDGRVQIAFCSPNACEFLYVKLTEGFNPK